MKNYYNYYLVALNFEEKDDFNHEIVKCPRIINLNNDMLNEKDPKELTNLAYIDNLTSKYEEGVMRRYLFDKGIIDNFNTPITIVRLSNGYREDNFGNRKSVTKIKYFCPIFKSKNSDLINNIALSTIRQRTLLLSDAGYLLQKFNDLYTYDSEYAKIARFIIDQYDIKHLLNYKDYLKDNKSNPIKYELLREVVSSMYEYEKSKNYLKFVEDVYGRVEFTRNIIKILPEKIEIKKSNLNPVQRLTKDDIERIKNDKWDNSFAQENLDIKNKNAKRDEKTLLTLTLEDKLRAGIIDDNEYIRKIEETEIKFRK